jgi:hypothetical protein
VPGRDSQARQVVACVLWCQSIKCPYTVVGAGATCVQVPSSEADLARGGVCRATLAGRVGHHGRDRVVHVFYVHGLVRVLRFFAGFKRVSPGYLGDPYGCPRQYLCFTLCI